MLKGCLTLIAEAKNHTSAFAPVEIASAILKIGGV
jgi:hypothetical protein